MAPPMIITSRKTEVYLQYGRRIIPRPAAISRKGQICVRAHKFSEGMLPVLTRSQTAPMAMSSNGPNIDLGCAMLSFFSIKRYVLTRRFRNLNSPAQLSRLIYFVSQRAAQNEQPPGKCQAG